MKKLLLPIVAFLYASIPHLALAVDPAASAKWEKDISAFEATDRAHPPEKGGILFVGSSSIRLWKTLAEDFPTHHVLNRGFGGSVMADSVVYADRIVIPYEPKLIVVYAGANDISGGKSPETVAADFREFVEKVRAKIPNEPIDYISIAGNPARWTQVEKVRAANALVEKYCHDTPGLKFIDVYSHMLGTDGLPRPEIFGPDKLHMNAEGYKLWRQLIGPYLD